jgi:hypothetical protein
MADRKISDLAALTTPVAGDYLPVVDISETTPANKNKRITLEELFDNAPYGTPKLPLPTFTAATLTYTGSNLTAVSYPGGEPYDYVGLTYTGDLLTQIDYKAGGSGGTIVASYQLIYTGNDLTSINEL